MQKSNKMPTHQPDWEKTKAYALARLERELSADLYYHSIQHTRDDVLPAAEQLIGLTGLGAEESLLLRTAALYHDLGFVECYSNNEPIAARMANETLPGFGFDPDQIQVIHSAILATQLPQTPHTFLEQLICDADLDSLGRDDYFTTSHNLLAELRAHGAMLTMRQWYSRQLEFLSAHSYFSEAARLLREAGKQKNIAVLRLRLQCLKE